MRAVVADEWAVLRAGVTVVLKEVDVRVVGQSPDAGGALACIRRDAPELLVLGEVQDLALPVAVRRIRHRHPEIRIVALVSDAQKDATGALLECGTEAVISRSASDQELRDAVARVRHGQRHIGHSLVDVLFGPAGLPSTSDERGLLTQRQRKVLVLLAEGHSNRQIAEALHIAETTVKTHLHHVYEKLGVSNRVQATAKATALRLMAI